MHIPIATTDKNGSSVPYGYDFIKLKLMFTMISCSLLQTGMTRGEANSPLWSLLVHLELATQSQKKHGFGMCFVHV